MRQITFYKTKLDVAPVEVFLDALSAKQAQKIVWTMQLVEELPRVSTQYLKKLSGTEEIWEIRAQVGSDIFRILGFFIEDSQFIATNGFQKKSMAVPRSEISLAQKRRQDYLKKQKRGQYE